MALGFVVKIDSVDTNIVPDKNNVRDNTPRVHRVGFGDGYEQRLLLGLNPIEVTFSVAFVNRPAKEISAIEDFLTDGLGAKSFSYTYVKNGTSEVTVKVVCESFNVSTIVNFAGSISAVFRKVNDP